MQNKNVRKLVADSFGDFDTIPRKDCLELRTKLTYFEAEDLVQVLAPVLLDLLENHSKSTSQPDWADSVVRFLCGPTLPPLDNSFGLLEPREIEVQNSLVERMEDGFKSFTVEQAKAVYAWLQIAQDWRASNIPEDEMNAALKFWATKASHS